MIVREVGPEQQDQWNGLIKDSPYGHILQSWEWGDFKKSMGNPSIRVGVFEDDDLVAAAQYTIHPVPYLKRNIGYLPKGPTSDPKYIPEILQALKTSSRENNLVFLKIEPNIDDVAKTYFDSYQEKLKEQGLLSSPKEIFAKHTFYLDLTLSEEELLARMHEKWRYNIRLSQRKGVEVEEQTDHQSLERFIELQSHTAKRNGFFIHSPQYYRNLWMTLQPKGLAHLLTAKVNGVVVAAWILFVFGKTLYYPYGASSDLHRETMPSHSLMWQSILLGKRLGCTRFDLWGATHPDAKNDPWIGFTRFKQGFGPQFVTFPGAYDLVLQDRWYKWLNLADKARWWWLRHIRSRL